MSALILPSGYGNQQIAPAAASGVWRPPTQIAAASALTLLWVPQYPLRNLATGATMTGAVPTMAPNAKGAAGLSVGALADTAGGPGGTGEYSVLVVASVLAASASQYVVSLGSGSGGSSNYVLVGVQSLSVHAVELAIFPSGGYTYLDGTLSTPPGTVTNYIALNSAGENRRELWADGGLVAKSTSLAAGATLSQAYILANGNASQFYTSPVNLVAIFNRALTPSEAAFLTVYPWALFRQRPRIYGFDAGSGAGGGVSNRSRMFIAM